MFVGGTKWKHYLKGIKDHEIGIVESPNNK